MKELTDNQFYNKCKDYGQKAKLWKQRFAGLLPEVLERNLHKKKRFTSIHEFASKLGGMSFTSVDKVLRLAVKLEDKPMLKQELITGTIHWSKIEKVAYVATPETEEEWVKKVRLLPRPALEVAVREARGGEPLPEDEEESWNLVSFRVSPEVEKHLRILKNSVEKQEKQSLSWNEAFKHFFQEGLSAENVTAIVCPDCAVKKGSNPNASRHIPVDSKRMVEALHGKTCVFRGCRKAAVTLHHTRRFALNPSHDPNFIVPLCHAHNQYVHAGLVDNETTSPKNWQSLKLPNQGDPKFQIDKKVQSHW